MNIKQLSLLAVLIWIGSACSTPTSQDASETVDSTQVEAEPGALNATPDWAYSATMYEVNVRQFSEGGTLKEFDQHLERLAELGVDILWFMPIQPIGVENRKGTLGSYYSISDYTAVNPEFGTIEDFKATVEKAHSLGMKVILDWVANHSAFDNPWAKSNPEWYTQDSAGNIIPPNPDWSDVADLNYDNADMRRAMIDAMLFWIKETDIDGFRCDVAGEVPIDFWEPAIEEIRAEKDVYMLAEWDEPYMHSCFNATYGWGFHHNLMEVGKGHYNLDSLRKQVLSDQEKFEKEAFKLRFTTNHDENSWKGTEEALFGPLTTSFQALIYALPGTPLLYSGQESVLDKQLEFFEKDLIDWKNYELTEFFAMLDAVREKHPAMWGGAEGGSLEFLGEDCSNGIFAFDRAKEDDRVRFIMNGNAEEADISAYVAGESNLTDLMTGQPFEGSSLGAHDFVLLHVSK